MTFSVEKNVTKKLRKASEQWILDRSTFARIMEKSGVSKMGKWKQVQEYANHIPSPLEHYLRNKDKVSGILLLDATFTKVKGQGIAVIIAYDTEVGVIDYWIDSTENKTAYSYIFQRLNKVGYRVKCVVSDGHFSILPILKEKKLPHQRCVIHLLRELKRKMVKRDFAELTGRNKILYSRIKGIFRTSNIEYLPERINFFRQRTEPLFANRKSILDWFWQVLPSAVLHLSYEEKVPCSTNLLENLNGQIKARLKTMRGMKSEKSLHNLLKILFYFRKYK